LSDVNDNPNISGARQFLRDYIGSNQDQIKSWLDGASRENFSAELILLSLEARKIGDAYDLSGIALGELIPSEPLLFLDNLPKSKKQIGWSAKYARRNLFVIKT
jgi:hypothetical protein